MPHQNPRLTVGIPVYNGERFLAQAVESLLGQTLVDFELLIADNASTDGTAAICAELARADARVRVLRHSTNIGAPRNWNCLVHEARGQYFKWASANDWCASSMLERCVEVLEADMRAVLCYCHTQLTDAEGHPQGVFGGDLDITMPRASDRFEAVCRGMTLNNAMCGVIRTSVLRKTGLDRLYPSGDMALTSELALHGQLRLLPVALNFRRQSAGTFTSMLSDIEIQRMYDPAAVRPMRLISGRRHLDNFECILRAPIGAKEKLRAGATAAHLMVSDRDRLWQEFRSLFKMPTVA